LKIHLNVILPSTPGSPQWSLSLRFPHQNGILLSSILFCSSWLIPLCYMKTVLVVFPSQLPASHVFVDIAGTNMFIRLRPYRVAQPLVSSRNFIRETYCRPIFSLFFVHASEELLLLNQRQPWTAGYAIPPHCIYISAC
jgi:hypothetical protein